MTEPDPAPDVPADSRNAAPHQFDRIISWLVFAVAFFVYAATACRTIYTGDDGDFASAIATWGIPHPTGYPLFIIVGRLWITLTAFVGDVPFRLNLLTAVCGAGGVAVFCRFLCELLDGLPWRRVWAATGALVLAFAPTLWSQSLSCEIYAPNILFLSTLLYLTQGWIRMAHGDTADKRLCLIAFVYGLSLTNHLTMALFFPGFMALVIWRKPTLFGKDFRVLFAVIGLLFLPLALYAYLPLAAKYSSSPAKWGLPVDGPSFWKHITGDQYHSLMFQSSAQFQRGLVNYATGLLPAEYGPFLIALSLLGIFLLLIRREIRPVGILLLYIFLADVLYASGYGIPDIFVYYVPSYLVIAAALAVVGAFATHYVSKRLAWDTAQETKYSRLVAPILAASILLHVSLHYAEADKSGNSVEADYAASIMNSCPLHAVLAVRSSVATTLWYRQFVLKDRPDVLVISQDIFPDIYSEKSWYLQHLLGREPDFKQYLPKSPVTADDFNNGEVLAVTLENFLRAGRPVVLVPIPDMEATLKKWQDQRQKAGVTAGALPDWFQAELNLSRRFDRVPWGVDERLYLKGTAPAPGALFPEVAALWTGEQPAIHPNWQSILTYQDRDHMQQPILFRWWESLVAWGKEAELAGHPELAAAAYERALTLYGDTNVANALERSRKNSQQSKNR